MLELAIALNLSPIEAVILPTAVSTIARKVELSEGATVRAIIANDGLRAYVSQTIKAIAARP